MVSEPSPSRNRYASQFGAHHVLDPTSAKDKDIPARVKELTDGLGANIAFDCAGSQIGLDQAVLALRAKGLLVNVAVWETTAKITPNNFAFRERRYMGIATYVAGDFQGVIDAIASGMSFSHLPSAPARPSTPTLSFHTYTFSS